MRGRAVFTATTDNWRTPSDIYKFFMESGYKDPCPFMSETDNLGTDMGGVNLFINPPYSDTKSWVDYAIKHVMAHPETHCIMLIPSRTDTKYFHRIMEDEGIDMGLYFFKGRLHFNDSKDSAPFPSCIIKISKAKGKRYIIDDYKTELTK